MEAKLVGGPGSVGSGCAPMGVGFESSRFRRPWRANRCRPPSPPRKRGAPSRAWGASPLLSAAAFMEGPLSPSPSLRSHALRTRAWGRSTRAGAGAGARVARDDHDGPVERRRVARELIRRCSGSSSDSKSGESGSIPGRRAGAPSGAPRPPSRPLENELAGRPGRFAKPCAPAWVWGSRPPFSAGATPLLTTASRPRSSVSFGGRHRSSCGGAMRGAPASGAPRLR